MLREFKGGPVVRTWGFHCHGPGSVSAQETKAPTSHAVKKINWSIKLEVRLLVPRHVLSHFVVSDSLWITEYWSGLPCPPPGVLPNPRREPRSPTLQVDSLLSEPPGKPWYPDRVRKKREKIGTLFCVYLVVRYSMWDLSSSTRDRTQALGSESEES